MRPRAVRSGQERIFKWLVLQNLVSFKIAFSV